VNLVKKSKLLCTLFIIFSVSGLLSWFGSVWLALPLGLLFSLFCPGLFLLLSIKKQVTCGWRDLVLIVGLGLSFIIFTTLLENTLLRATGVTRPLTAGNLWLTFSLTGLATLLGGYYRWSENPLRLSALAFSKHDLIATGSSVVLLLGCVLGAIRLNNGASGTLAIACYLGMTALICYIFIVHQKLRVSSIIFVLWLITMGVLLSSWLRGSYAAGPDLDKEFQLFELVKGSGYWSINLYRNAYTACLSITLLPTSLSYFTKLSNLQTYKLLLPMLYSFIAPVVFLVARSRIGKRGAILATIFFIAQPPFTIWWWIPVRQEIAFLFFGLIVLLLTELKDRRALRVLFLIFGAAMVVSHYSTSYIAIGLLFIYTLVEAVHSRYFSKARAEAPFLRYTYVLLLVLFSFLWYSQLTYGFNGATQFITKSFDNVGSLFKSDVQQQGQSPLDHLDIFSTPGSTSINPIQYYQDQYNQASRQYGKTLYATNYGLQFSPYTPVNSILAQNLSLTRSLLKVTGNVLVSLGVLVGLVVYWKKKALKRINFLQLSSLLFFGVALFLPFFSISYGEDRLYEQLLIVMSGSIAIYTSLPFLSKRWRQVVQAGLLLFVIAYFLVLNEVPQQFTTSSAQSIAFSNSSEQYDEYYIATSDVVASQWLAKTRNVALPIYGDHFSQYRLVTEGGLSLLSKLHTGVFPNALPKNSYVYQSAVNTRTQTAFDDDGSVILYRFPSNFLSTQKNTIYSNGQDIIYR
jgi:uncharacterized membrane protein